MNFGRSRQPFRNKRISFLHLVAWLLSSDFEALQARVNVCLVSQRLRLTGVGGQGGVVAWRKVRHVVAVCVRNVCEWGVVV